MKRNAHACQGVTDRMYLCLPDWGLPDWHCLWDEGLVPADVDVIGGLKLEQTEPLIHDPLNKGAWEKAARALHEFVAKHNPSAVVIGSEPMWEQFWFGLSRVDMGVLAQRTALLPKIEIHAYPGSRTFAYGDRRTVDELADRNVAFVDAWQRGHEQTRFFVDGHWSGDGKHPREADNREVAWRVTQILNQPRLEVINWLWRFGHQRLATVARALHLCKRTDGLLYMDYAPFSLPRVKALMQKARTRSWDPRPWPPRQSGR